MAFRAVHQQWGTVFAHLPDLGCGRAWEAIWKVRPPAPLTCDECRHPMYAKTSPSGLRFFAHAPKAPGCALAGESLAHHLLKLELANAARAAGAHAELEVPGPDGWRADVLATDPAGTWKTALEAQLSPLTVKDIRARTERMRSGGVTSIWFSDRPRPPWLGTVPSARLTTTSDGGSTLTLAEGLVKFDRSSWHAVPATLTQFLTWAFTGRIVPRSARAHLAYPLTQLTIVWTALHHIQAEDSYLTERERHDRAAQSRAAAFRRSQERKREEIRRKNAVSRADALREATAAEQAARLAPDAAARARRSTRRPGVARALAYLSTEHDINATVGFSTGDPRYADGIPLIDDRGIPVAVFDPVPSRVRGQAFRLLAGMLLLFWTKKDQSRFKAAMNRQSISLSTPTAPTTSKAAPAAAPPRAS